MSIDDRNRYILDLLNERGPLSNDTLALEGFGDQTADSDLRRGAAAVAHRVYGCCS